MLTQLVPIEELEIALGIEEGDTTARDFLIEQEARIASFIERETATRFRAPVSHTDILAGRGHAVLFLSGHIGTATPAIATTVGIAPSVGAAAVALAADRYAIRGRRLIRIGDVWHWGTEVHVTYASGYAATEVPGEIKELVIQLVRALRDAATGEAGITSESIGGYSYNRDLAASVSDAQLLGTPVAQRILNGWRRRRA